MPPETRELAVDRVPFVGPRPYEANEAPLFFGRDGEIAELAALVIAHRTVLLYSPSGAGKSSLIQAGLVPRLAAAQLPVTRIARLAVDNLDPVVLLGDLEEIKQPHLAVIDQFEELYARVTHRQERRDFFDALAAHLEAFPMRRLLISVREDWLGELSDTADILPGGLRTRFRLEKLTRERAVVAVERPFALAGKRFEPGVVEKLVEDLAAGGDFVEPVQLQVVCLGLYERLPPGTDVISQKLRQSLPTVQEALQNYYERCIAEAAAHSRVSRARLRRWFDERLITSARTRGLSRRGETTTDGVSNRAVDFLESRHIIRAEVRHPDRWYELSHDRLLDPILQANSSWRVRRRAKRYVGLGVAAVLIIAGLAAALGRYARLKQSADDAAQRANAARMVAEEASRDAVAKNLVNHVLRMGDADRNDELAFHLLAVAQKLNPNETGVGGPLFRLLAEPYHVRVLPSGLPQVLAVSYSPKGNSLAVAGEGSTIRIWNPGGEGAVVDLPCDQSPCTSLSWSPDGERLAIGSSKGSLRIVRVGTKATEYVDTVHRTTVKAVAWNVDGSLVAAADTVGAIAVVDPASRSRTTLAPQPQGTVESLSYSRSGLLAAASWDRRIHVWNASNRHIATSSLRRSPVTAVTWSPDGQRLSSAGWDDQVRVWDLRGNSLEQIDAGTHEGRVFALAWSPDGRHIISGSGEQTIKLWNAADFSAGPVVLHGVGGTVRSLAWAPDSAGFASVADDASVRLWTRNPQVVAAISLGGHQGGIRAVAANAPPNSVAAGYGEGTVALWRLGENEQRPGLLSSALTTVRAVAWATWPHDGEEVVAAIGPMGPAGRNAFVTWLIRGDFRTARLIFRRSRAWIDAPASALAASPAAADLAVGTATGSVVIFRLGAEKDESGREFKNVTPSEVVNVEWSAGGDALHVLDRSGTMATITPDGTLTARRTFPPACKTITAIAWHPGLERLAEACGRELYVGVVAGGKFDTRERHSLPAETATLRWSRNGQWLAFGLQNGVIGLAGDGTVRNSLLVPAHSGSITALGWSADDAWLETGASDNSVRLWPAKAFRADPCAFVNGTFSRNSWMQYVSDSIPYTPACTPAARERAGAKP